MNTAKLTKPVIEKKAMIEKKPTSANSLDKPFKVSWIVESASNTGHATDNYALSSGKSDPQDGKNPLFGICACPGKNLAKGRDGKVHKRDINADVKYFKESLKIDIIICLLNKYELKTIGVDLDKYQSACNENGIQMMVYPIVEMGVPIQSAQEFDTELMNFIMENMKNNKRMACHCRGGIGRAGTVASCLLLKTNLCKNPKLAITTVRNLRDKRCVESRKQEDYIAKYSQSLKGEGADAGIKSLTLK